jgi:hypothetical protein
MGRTYDFRRYATEVARRLHGSEMQKYAVKKEIYAELEKQYKVSLITDPRLLMGTEDEATRTWQERIDFGMVSDTHDYKSSIQVGNLPLIHITSKPNSVARGIIAIGPIAIGVIAIGGFAIGLFSFGGMALGILLTFGGVSLSTLFAFGGMAAAGWMAFGGLAVAYQYAIGGVAVAKSYAFGGVAVARVAIGREAYGWLSVFRQEGTGDILLPYRLGYETLRREILKVVPDFPSWLLQLLRIDLFGF